MSEVSVQTNGGGAIASNSILQARQLLQSPGHPILRKNSRKIWSFSPPKRSEKLPAATALPVARAETSTGAKNPRTYAMLCLLLIIAGVAAVWNGNKSYAPEMYAEDGMVAPSQALANGQNYAVFDLNLNIRKLRDEQVARFTETPDLVLLGASHWQEANAGLVPHLKMYNAHVHRDYWEDPLGVTEILVRHNRLPKKMIIAIRDNQFTPVSERKDFLWEPGIPFYRAMADRLGLEKETLWETFPYQRVRSLFSLSMLFDNFTRWQNADERPHASLAKHFESLDALLPDGSITWSDRHMQLFTPERSKKEALNFSALRANSPPLVDPKGVAAFDRLLTYLKSQGVTVYLVNPPFNPIYYDSLRGTPYATGLKKIEALTANFAAAHGLRTLGSFNPHKVGCDASMYIDAEHANAKCLKKIFDEFSALDVAKGGK